MEQEKRIEVGKEVKIARTIGGLIENKILDVREQKRPVEEELRLLMREGMIKAGVEVDKLAGKSKDEVEVSRGISLHQAEYKNVDVGAAILVDFVLGTEKMDRMLNLAMDEVWKHKDHPKFESKGEMIEYVMGIMGQIRERGSAFKFDIAKLSGGDDIKKAALWRLEAIVHTSFKLMRLASFGENEDGKNSAEDYQRPKKNKEGETIGRFEKFKQRVIKGHIREVGRENASLSVKALEDATKEGKNIRHLNPGTMGAILEGLMS